MDQIAGVGTLGSRRNEDIALDMMKFIASTTGYGRTTGGAAAGFHAATETKSEDYATHAPASGSRSAMRRRSRMP